MFTFPRTAIFKDERNTSIRPLVHRACRRHGFTLIELLVVIAIIAVLIALLLPAVQAAREAARRIQCVNNLKQLGLAMHNYHDANGFFPQDSVDAKTGKPLLSWRVHLLPYMEEALLYQSFKLDEPWDSEHNIKLLDKLPKVFAPTRVKAKAGETFYRGFGGKGETQASLNPI